MPEHPPEVLFTAAREGILTVDLTPDSLGARLCSDQHSSQNFQKFRTFRMLRILSVSVLHEAG